MDRDAGAMGTELRVRVLDLLGPVDGATVTAVHAAGGAVSATTGADGRATLAGVLEDDVLHTTADGRLPFTFTRIPNRDEAAYFDGEGTLSLRVFRRVSDLSRVTVRGAFSNGDAAADWRIVSPTPFVGSAFAGPADYEIMVSAGEASVATVLEFDVNPCRSARAPDATR
ncbi:MAG: carboxypeptidase regulatory-like domain-containing protein [Sandaracinaceae bacterium]|nr:carboxypeptidase regulatory-like domain-containing protein [Sandaracinaceae bacterium]